MSLKGLRVGFVVFFILSSTVAVNILLLQPGRQTTDRIAGAWQSSGRSQIETASVSVSQNYVPRNESLSGPKAAGLPEPRSDRPSIQRVTVSGAGHSELRQRIKPAATANTADMIRAIQRELKLKGYDPGDQDGQAGLITRAAIFAFEFDNRRALTATPSQALLQSILLGESGADPDRRARPEDLSPAAHELVLVAQRGLKQQGFWNGPLNGEFDTQFSRAIQRFETAKSLATTGRISGRFMARLVRLSGGKLVASRF